MNPEQDAPYHAHIYFSPDEQVAAEDLKSLFETDPDILFVGRMTSAQAGPHPIPQYEVHFLKRTLNRVSSMIRSSGLRALVHPLTDDDLADHTTGAEWIGEPVELDLTTLDPPGRNQGVERFGKSDF